MEFRSELPPTARVLTPEEEQSLTTALADAARQWRTSLLMRPLAQKEALGLLEGIRSGTESPHLVLRDTPSHPRETSLRELPRSLPALQLLVRQSIQGNLAPAVDDTLSETAEFLEEFPLKFAVIKRIHETLAAIVATLRSPVPQTSEIIETFEPPDRFAAGMASADAARETWIARRNELVEHNMALVWSLAAPYITRSEKCSLDNLAGEGMLGLMHAAEDFDPTAGFRFSTYAVSHIRKAVTCAFWDEHHGAAPPVPGEVVKRLVTAADSFEQRTGRLPEPAELADITAVPLHVAARVLAVEGRLRDRIRTFSIDSNRWSRGIRTESLWKDDIRAADGNPADEVECRLLPERIGDALLILTPQERDILTMRYGLGTTEPHTLEQCARMLGISRECVRQHEIRALRKLRNGDGARLLEDFAPRNTQPERTIR